MKLNLIATYFDLTSFTFEQLLFIVLLVVLYLLRKLPFFSWVWKMISAFFFVLFATIFADIAKDKIKDWWNK